MSVDIPRGWEITDSVEPEYHHNQCSFNTHSMLCDCNVLFKHPEFLDEENFYGKGGVIIRKLEPKP